MTFVYESQSRDNALLVTERCNCRCLTCPQPPKATEEPRTVFNRELIRLMAPGPESLAITGGEPTLPGDDFLTLLGDCKTRLPNTNVIILSNGRRFKDRMFVEQIARLGHPRLTVAVALYGDLDSLHDEIVGVRGAFNETVRGLYNLALYRFLVEIRVVISSLNYQRLAKIVDFIYANMPFACHVALMGLETVGLAAENLERIWVDPFDYRHELEQSCRYLSGRMIPVSIYNLPLCVVPARSGRSPSNRSRDGRTSTPRNATAVRSRKSAAVSSHPQISADLPISHPLGFRGAGREAGQVRYC